MRASKVRRLYAKINREAELRLALSQAHYAMYEADDFLTVGMRAGVGVAKGILRDGMTEAKTTLEKSR